MTAAERQAARRQRQKEAEAAFNAVKAEIASIVVLTERLCGKFEKPEAHVTVHPERIAQQLREAAYGAARAVYPEQTVEHLRFMTTPRTHPNLYRGR